MIIENNNIGKKEFKEKRFVAFSSVLAAIFLTGTKLIVGLLTGSLGILSEALHSGLDLVAAVMTFFAVKIADKPADNEHNYGHGKIENLSALAETVLLFVTCFWIIYEALNRLLYKNTEIEVTVWSFAVVIFSIILDITRSRALSKVAKKYNSQALEADALHFSTDILSSSVVLVGLISAYFGYHSADSFAALIVAVVVAYISFRIGKKSIDALIDRTPKTYTSQQIINMLLGIKDLTEIHDVKLRTSGPDTFVEVNIHVDSKLNIEDAHNISHLVEETIKAKIRRCKVHIHIEPEDGI